MPHYAEDLQPLGGKIYITPAEPERVQYQLSTFKYGEEISHVEMQQAERNTPSFGRAKEIAPESVFTCSEALHADVQSKPYTVGVLPGRYRDMIELRVSLLHSDLFQPFVQAMLRQMPGGELRLRQTRLSLGDVIGTPAPQGHIWAGYHVVAGVQHV